MFPLGLEPRTLCVLGTRDNHYTTETTYDECCLILLPLVQALLTVLHCRIVSKNLCCKNLAL